MVNMDNMLMDTEIGASSTGSLKYFYSFLG